MPTCSTHVEVPPGALTTNSQPCKCKIRTLQALSRFVSLCVAAALCYTIVCEFMRVLWIVEHCR